MKNKLPDLNNHLFAELERLSDESIKGEALVEEVERAKAVVSVATKITDVAKVAIDAEKLRLDYQKGTVKLPKMLGHDDA